MFSDNKYTKTYYALIGKRQIYPIEGYSEEHHIIPRSLGGTDEKENLIRLTAREHFIAHLLLTKMVTESEHVRKMFWALHRMCFSGIDYFNGRSYEWYRRKHVEFLKEYHPMKRLEVAARVSAITKKEWENNDERRAKTSQVMKENWKRNYERLSANSKRVAKLGGEAARLATAKRIEYNGTEYLGWAELLQKTGVSKFLYKKFYEKGIDPSFRIGKDGPMTKDDIEFLITWFCTKHSVPEPMDRKSAEKILNRMKQIGIVTDKEMERYLDGKESRSWQKLPL